MMLHNMLSWLPTVKKLHAGHLNGYYEQDDDAVKYFNTINLHHADENNITANHAGENELTQKTGR